MAQRGSGRKQAPAYSADAMALRYMAGLALIALGAIIFMAVELNMAGNIFEGLRRVCYGLCGILAYILPALILWAGGLVIWSTQKKAPVLPWVFGVLAFIGICTFMMITGAMDYLKQQFGDNWGAVIHGVYEDSAARMARASGGGAIGTVLAWPLWKYLGTVLGTAIVFILTAMAILMAFNLTPSRIRDLLTGQAGQRREQQQAERERAEQQQMAWQQQQEMQRAAWQEQQARILQQQQQQQYMQNTPQQMPQQGMTGQGMPLRNDGGVSNWQDLTTTSQLVSASAGHQSRIFGRKRDENPNEPDSSFRSRIFGRNKKEEYDGLSDGSTLKQQGQMPQETGERRTRRTATGEEVRQPQTHWAQPAAEEAAAAESPTKKRKTTADAQPVWPDRPETPPAQPEPDPQMKQSAPQPRQPATQPRQSAAQTKQPATSAAEYSRPAEEKPEKKSPAKPVIPAVQQTIGEEAYKPPVKLPPKADTVRTAEDDSWTPTPYNYPPITDLAMPRQGIGDTSAEDEMRSRKLEETLASFKVQARVVHVTHGPAISRFELELAAGTKVNKVSELEKDIAYGMSATSVRIEAPIPGKSLVGVEVPNQKVATVTLREVLQSDRMQNAKSLLTVALGRDIAGTPIVCDLAKMPHMLIAGQTGSGKSVCINAIINSLLYRAGPDEVKLILVDPKVVELQCYNGIPHLLIPVVNDPHKAAAALAWAVAEMMERYDKFAERKVRNLEGYNSVIAPTEKPMSRIVIIIDELADLMMVCKKDVEEYICRLTQLARAAGIHLIVATQRPSVDVITGLIKANIPSRIAFKTASYVDSRTILDRNGAEQLLGWGDMLYLPTGAFSPTRVQGCFLSDEEVNNIVKHVKDANPSTYDPDILEKLDQIASGNTEGGADIIINSSDMSGGDGGLFEQAVEFAIADGQISTSTLQRRLKIGYARAGRLTDEMEERGIVAAKDGSKPRKCLITREEWEEMKNSTEGMA
jgi:S-DNA-T family DNA segregation ATPase FtsK/SpoIIIE